MSTEDMMDLDERDDARALLTRAVGTEPALGLVPEVVLGRARASVDRRRLAAFTGAAAVLVATITAAALIAPSQNASVPTESASPSPSPGRGGAQCKLPPDATPPAHIVAVPPAAPDGQPAVCVLGSGTPSPVRPIFDQRAQDLTTAFANGRVIPGDVQPVRDPHAPFDVAALRFFLFEPPASGQKHYYAYAALKDAAGWSALWLHVDRGEPRNVTCGQPGDNSVSCESRALPGGVVARVARYRNNGPSFIETRLDAVRPDGSAVHATCTNGGDPAFNDEHHVSRGEPVLSVEDMFKIAQIAGLRY